MPKKGSHVPAGTSSAWISVCQALGVPSDDPLDFEREMYRAVVEEASLAELPLGASDGTGTNAVPHGPWDPAECSSHMLICWTKG